MLTHNLWAIAACAASTTASTPSWYDGNRVHMHTRMALCGSFLREPISQYGVCKGQNWLQLAEDHTDESTLPYWWSRVETQNITTGEWDKLPFEQRNTFWDLASNVKRANVSVVTRGMKFAHEGPWWPSQAADGVVSMHPNVMNYANKTNGDLANTLLADSEQQGVHTIAYYRHPDDIWGELNHPEWIARNRAGEDIMTNTRGKWMSLTSEYGDYVVQRVAELVERGAAGIYFDERHVPEAGDFNVASQEMYASVHPNRTGLLDADAKQVKGFRQLQMETFFSKVVAAVDAVAVDRVILVSANQVAADTIRRAGGVPKTEPYHLGTIGSVEMGCSVLTDTAGGYPHVWVTTIHTEEVYSTYLAYGCIYNRDVREYDFYDLPKIPARRIVRGDDIEHVAEKDLTHILEMSAVVSPAMESVVPYRKVRVVHNGAMLINDMPNQVQAAYETLLDLRLAVGFYTFRQLETLGSTGLDTDTDVLVFPTVEDYDSLLPWLKPTVDAFLQMDGKSVDYGEVDSTWYSSEIFDTGYRISKGVKVSMYRHESDTRNLVINFVVSAKKQTKSPKFWLSRRQFYCEGKDKPKAKNVFKGKKIRVRKKRKGGNEYFRMNVPKNAFMAQIVFTLCE